jgi:hypothetical protein
VRRYCDNASSPGCHLTLLRILLSPGEGAAPRLGDACLVLNSAGGSELDPLEVLDAMSPATALTAAMPTLSRILRERIHRARDRRLVSCLERSVNLDAKAELAEAKQRQVGNLPFHLLNIHARTHTHTHTHTQTPHTHRYM